MKYSFGRSILSESKCCNIPSEFDQNDSNCLRDLILCIKPHQGDEYNLPSSQILFAHCGTLRKTIKRVSFGL